jgi:hypothetical protein
MVAWSFAAIVPFSLMVASTLPILAETVGTEITGPPVTVAALVACQ